LASFTSHRRSFAVAARRGHIFATLCLGRLRVLRAAVGLSFAWPATCSRRLGPKVFARPSRSASAGREAGHDRSRTGRAEHVTVALAKHSPSIAGLDDSSHRLLLKRSVAAALPAGPFAGGIMRRAPNFWSNLFRPIQGPKASILWQGLMCVGSHRGRRLRRRKSSCFLRGEASLGQPCSPFG